MSHLIRWITSLQKCPKSDKIIFGGHTEKIQKIGENKTLLMRRKSIVEIIWTWKIFCTVVSIMIQLRGGQKNISHWTTNKVQRTSAFQYSDDKHHLWVHPALSIIFCKNNHSCPVHEWKVPLKQVFLHNIYRCCSCQRVFYKKLTRKFF